jgi:hypothetical protein
MAGKEVNKITSVKPVGGSSLKLMTHLLRIPMNSSANASKCMPMAWDFEALNESKVFTIPLSLLGSFNGGQAIKCGTLEASSSCTRFDADNMTQIYQDLLTQAYSDFNRRDINAVLAVMHPQVEWANGMEGGYVYGHEAVRDYWTRQWNLVDPHVEPQSFQLDDNQRIIVDVHQVVRDLEGNVLVDQLVQHLHTFENGLIRRMDIQELPS